AEVPCPGRVRPRRAADRRLVGDGLRADLVDAAPLGRGRPRRRLGEHPPLGGGDDARLRGVALEARQHRLAGRCLAGAAGRGRRLRRRGRPLLALGGGGGAVRRPLPGRARRLRAGPLRLSWGSGAGAGGCGQPEGARAARSGRGLPRRDGRRRLGSDLDPDAPLFGQDGAAQGDRHGRHQRVPGRPLRQRRLLRRARPERRRPPDRRRPPPRRRDRGAARRLARSPAPPAGPRIGRRRPDRADQRPDADARGGPRCGPPLRRVRRDPRALGGGDRGRGARHPRRAVGAGRAAPSRRRVGRRRGL
ncbi:MAG: putative membrane protein, partial [uncultured Thermomicrobiales bacterium]